MKYFLVVLLTLVFAPLANAYTGPGLGLGIIGTVVGVVFSLLLAILAVFWYPLKRALKIGKKKTDTAEEAEEEAQPVVEKVSDPQ
ncbi:Uncharacterised protein [Halioglobus japonicus]|nr:Uncharacterised protein [Halioglobus japonicus]